MQKEYKSYDWMRKVILCELLKTLEFFLTDKSHMHKQEFVLENLSYKFLWTLRYKRWHNPGQKITPSVNLQEDQSLC